MIRIILFFLVTTSCLLAKEMNSSQEWLAREEQTEYRIIIPEKASSAEKYAAEELALFLGRITGAKFPVFDETQPASSHEICLGKNNRLSFNVDWNTLGHEGYILRTEGSRLFIVGGRPRGTLYGVYSFLEEELGCRWFTPKVEFIPDVASLVLPNLNRQYVPPLIFRDIYYVEARDGDWAARNRVNGRGQKGLEVKHGGNWRYASPGFVHTLHPMMTPGYFNKHPEYYALSGGKRRFTDHIGRGNLCLSNPQVLTIVIGNVRKYLQKNPHANIISVSQMDWGGMCECPDCRRIVADKGSNSGIYLWFVNQVADALKDEFPNIYFDTIAYKYTRMPPVKNGEPTITARPNVIVRLCPISMPFSQPYATNKTLKKMITGWDKVCKNLWVWDYVLNDKFYILPHPNLLTLGEHVRFYVENGVSGIFEQGNSFITHSEFAELRSYILAKVLWMPNTDIRQVMKEFVSAYYGKAAPSVLEYIDYSHNNVIKSKSSATLTSTPRAGFLSREFLNKADKILEKAENLAETDQTRQRVERIRIGIWYVMLKRPEFPISDELREYAQRLEQIVERDGIERVDGRGNEAFFSTVKKLLNRQHTQKSKPLPPSVVRMSVSEMSLSLGTKMIDDPSADNGQCAEVPIGAASWAVQCYFGAADTIPGHKYTMLVRMRVKKIADTKKDEVVGFGIYDMIGRSDWPGFKSGLRMLVEKVPNNVWKTYVIETDLSLQDNLCAYLIASGKDKTAGPQIFVDWIELRPTMQNKEKQ